MKFSFLFLVLFASASWAAKVGVEASQYTYHCGYFSSLNASLRVSYSNPDIPMESRVKLISGWGGYKFLGAGRKDFFGWKNRTERDMIGFESSAWAVEFSEGLHYRTSAQYKDTLQFVFEVTLPNGERFYDKGTDTNWGYYQSVLPYASSKSTCLHPGELPGPKHAVNVEVVHKQ